MHREIAVAASWMVFASLAQAQAVLEEVTVTAQKREQNLQDVGVAVNAFEADLIRELKIETTADVARFTPNMTTRNTMGDTMPIITIRGVGSATNDILFANSPPSVAVHLDEVYLGSPSLLMGANFDLERVEVLKGPQGTLYGRNTTAGTVNFVSAKPKDSFGADVTVGYGRYATDGDWFEASGYVTDALTDSLSGRLAFAYKKGDQFVTDFSGKPYDGPDRLAARGLLSWHPADTLDVLLNVHASRDRPASYAPQIAAVMGANCPYARTGAVDLVNCRAGAVPQNILLSDGVTVVPFTEPSNPFDTDVWRNASSTRDRQDMQGKGMSLHANLSLTDDVTLTSISAYEDADVLRFENFSGRDVPQYYDIRHHDLIEQFSQELRLSGSHERLYWVTGAYYFREDIDYAQKSHFQSSSIGLGPNGEVPYALPEQYRTLMSTTHLTSSVAAFGQAEYQLTDRLKGIVGARYTYEEKEYLRNVSYNIQRASSDTLVSVGRINPTNGRPALRYRRADSTTPLQADWDNVSWKVGLDYQVTPDIMTYGSVSTGFKGGTFSGSSLILPEPLARPANPERLTAAELGIKSTLLEGRLRLNAAAFHYQYKDLQIFSTVRTSSGDNSSILDNISKARVNGLDLDAAWRPLPSLTLGLALGYMDGEYQDFVSEGRDFSGLDLVNAPELTVTGRASYEWPTAMGAFTLAGNAAYTSEVDLDFRDNLDSTVDFDRARAQFVAAAHTLIDARVAWRNLAGNVEAAVWVRNITNEEVLTHATFGAAEAVLFYDAPRSTGVNLTLTF